MAEGFVWRFFDARTISSIFVNLGLRIPGLRAEAGVGLFDLSQIFHQFQPLILLVDVDLFVQQLVWVLVLFLVNSLAFSI